MERPEAIKLLVAQKLQCLSPEEKASRIIDYWSIDAADEEFHLLPEHLQMEITQEEEPADVNDPGYIHLLSRSLLLDYKGVKNEYISDEMKILLGRVEEVTGEVETLFACPCCGYLTLPDIGEYSICRVCWWEDDGSRSDSQFSGPNHMTLREGQANFRQHGICDPKLSHALDRMAILKYLRSSGR